MDGSTLASPAMLSRSEIAQRIAAYAKPNSVMGYGAFALDMGGWMLCIAGVLFFEHIAAKIACSILAGVFLLNLGVLAHEAAHGALVKGKRANKALAVTMFTVLMFNYRLWIYEHHTLHHKQTNVREGNSWAPLSPAEYEAKGPIGRALYRLYRSPTGLGIGVYYLIERWFGGHFYPGSWLPDRFRPSAWRYTVSLGIYAVVAMTALALIAPQIAPIGPVAAVVLGFIVPFLFWVTAFSLSVCLQHVAPGVPWYWDAKGVDQPVEELTVHIRMPWPINVFTHHAMDHPVHHINGKVPFYRLREAQAELSRMTGHRITGGTYTPGHIGEIMRVCKLYDYERHLWVDFAGQVTAIPRTAAPRDGEGRPVVMAGARPVPDPSDYVLAGEARAAQPAAERQDA
jgi:acyl-lipid omega-6 desaturase (Delta-12 desaturase)